MLYAEGVLVVLYFVKIDCSANEIKDTVVSYSTYIRYTFDINELPQSLILIGIFFPMMKVIAVFAPNLSRFDQYFNFLLRLNFQNDCGESSVVIRPNAFPSSLSF